MADTFAVCMTAKTGSNIVFSRVASLNLASDFESVFTQNIGDDDKYELFGVLVSSKPQGPWQSVDKSECTSVLRDLAMRHIVFTVKENQPVRPEPRKPRSAFAVMMASSAKRAFPSKKNEMNAKDRMFNDLLLYEFTEKKLDFPASQADEVGQYTIQVG